MEAISDIFAYAAGAPAMVGLMLTSLIMFVTSDWRLSLTALLVQYILIGITLVGSLRIEIALVKILVGVLTVSILYLTARRLQEAKGPDLEGSKTRFFGMQVAWASGPLGLPLRLLTVLLVVLAVIRVFGSYRLPLVPADLAFATVWLGAMGMAALVLSGDSLRVATALLTILGGFDLVYASLEPSLATVGFWGTLSLLTALAFAYLAVVHELGLSPISASPQLPESTPGELDSSRESLPAQTMMVDTDVES
jgi:hypothetical protein